MPIILLLQHSRFNMIPARVFLLSLHTSGLDVGDFDGMLIRFFLRVDALLHALGEPAPAVALSNEDVVDLLQSHAFGLRVAEVDERNEGDVQDDNYPDGNYTVS